MPVLYRIVGFGFIAVLVLVAGTMIGAVLYEAHIAKAAPDDFWARWQAIVGSFGVLAAIGVAIYTDIKVDKRFERQVEVQTELDRNADERQQAEWTKRAEDAVSERNVLRHSIRMGLMAELAVCAQRAKFYRDNLESDHDANYVQMVDDFENYRPVYERMGTNAVMLNSRVLAVITSFEPGYRQAERAIIQAIEEANNPGLEFRDTVSRDAHIENVLEAFDSYIAFVDQYAEGLQHQE